jgi:anionic cell wall polymer biosynthesis LytR-Cps2A-Psr (LCP) family protein
MGFVRFKLWRLLAERILLGVFFVVVFCSSALASYFLLGVIVKPTKSSIDETQQVQEITKTQQELLDLETEGLGDDLERTYNLLLLGYGGAGHDGGYLTDVVKVINTNFAENQITVISVPRDLWVSLPIRSDKSKYFKINAAYAIGLDDRGYPLKQPQYRGQTGAAQMAREAVEKVIGMEIDNCIAVGFEGFKKAIDALGEIEVNVPVAFEDRFYPVKGLENETCGKSPEEIADLHDKYSGFQLERQFECRYELLSFKKGKQMMNGEAALKFVRSRHSDTHGGDFARAQRQLAVLLALKNKVLSIGALEDLPAFFNQFKGIIKTDLKVKVASELLKEVSNPEEFEIRSIHLTDENVLENARSSDGQLILVPKEGIGKWGEIREFVKEGS